MLQVARSDGFAVQCPGTNIFVRTFDGLVDIIRVVTRPGSVEADELARIVKRMRHMAPGSDALRHAVADLRVAFATAYRARRRPD